jgi:membrane protein
LVKLLARGPKRPSELSFRIWLQVCRRTVVEFIDDNLDDKAAALTYYSIMSIFPGLLVFVAAVGLLGRDATETIINDLRTITPGPGRQIIADSIENLQRNQGTAGVLAIVGVAVAFWSATGYIGAFTRAANQIYDVPEGRPLWKTLPMQFLFTIATGLFLAASALAVVFSGRLAEQAGAALGVKDQAVEVFEVAKWPVLALGVSCMLALLYWAAPNVRHGGFRWITPGTLVAMVTWIAASAGFVYYVSQFDTYNKTYGTLGGVIVFLVWLWLTNVAVLLGAEFDAELARARAMAAGLPRHAEPYLPLRDIPNQSEPITTPAFAPDPADPA